MDARLYATYTTETQNPSCYHWITDSPYALLKDLLDGTISGYSLANFFQNNADYISSLKFFPVNLDAFVHGKTTDFVKLGSQILTTYTGWYSFMGINPYHKVLSFSLPKTFNNFLDFAPYTKVYLYFPFFDLIPLDSQLVYGYYDEIDVYVSLDFNTGIFTIYVEREDGTLITRKECKIGLDIPIGKTNAEEIKRANVLQSISLMGSAMTIAFGGATGNPIATGVGVTTATKAVTTALQNNVNRVSSISSASGNIGELVFDKVARLIIERPQNVKYPDLHLKGKPCRKNLTLSSVTGYTEIGEIHFNPSGYEIYDDEIEEITQLMKSGIVL